MLNHKGNAEDHIIQLKREKNSIPNNPNRSSTGQPELETAWKLLETCIQPILT